MRKLRLSIEAVKIRLLDITVIGVSIFIVVVLVAVSNRDVSDIAFESEKWRADSSWSTCSFLSPASVRSRMAKDLARILLETTPRLGKRDVEQILGEPEFSKTQRLWSYRAGASTMDCLTFDVVFDHNGVVVDARHVQH